MMEEGLRARIRELNEWIVTAGDALLTFYDAKTGMFRRDSTTAAGGAPTSTNRGYFALHEYQRFLREENQTATADTVTACLQEISTKYVARLVSDPGMRKSSVNDVNLFTDSHLLLTLALLRGAYATSVKNIGALMAEGTKLANATAASLAADLGGKIYITDRVHDFVTLHAVRGLDAFTAAGGPAWTPRPEMQQRVKDDVVRLLGYHFSFINSRFDVASLTFSTSLLNRFKLADTSYLTLRAIKSIAEVQSLDGSWHTRVLFSNPAAGSTTHLYIASYELALALTMLLVRELAGGQTTLAEDILPCLSKTFQLVQANFVRGDTFRGWANDHTLHLDVIESWATAIVLAFLIQYRDALSSMRRLSILRKYKVTEAGHPPAFMDTWPDLAWALRDHEQLDASSLAEISDPTKDGQLAQAIEREIVKPIGSTAIRRPSNTSLILYGPPGSRKTTLVRRIASALKWPLLVFFPPHFLPKGLEGFEAAAAEIFADLSELRRAVVFFDECEAFFKSRKARNGGDDVDSRTLGAFITAGMLPRLQDLHDGRWLVFVLGTNDEPSDLDSAVTRMGRFDFVQRLEYPTIEAQKRYIEAKLSTNKAAAKLLSKGVDAFRNARKNEVVTFSMLDTIAREAGTFATPQDVSMRLVELSRPLPPNLTD